jgi:glutamine amidotransferase-like uncharacterized protein
MRHDILIYNDEKTAIGSLVPSLSNSFNTDQFNLIRIKAKDIRNGVLDRPQSRFLILPGIIGDVSPYTDQLGNGEMNHVADFLRRGNVMLAKCAGAAFVSKSTIFTPHYAPARSRTAVTPLFNGVARVPVGSYGRECSPESSFSDVLVVPVRYKDIKGSWHETGICYGNGPALYTEDPNDPSVEILGRYTNIPGEPAAIIRQKVGAGTVYLSCVLADIGYQYIEPQPNLQNAIQLMSDLKPYEAGRKALWDDLTTRIKNDLDI